MADIPIGYRIPLVSEVTWLLPTLTMDAINIAVGQHMFTIDTDYASLDAALAATATGGVMEVRGTYTRATTFTVNKACTIRFTNGGGITASSSSIAAMTITASSVTLDAPRLVGTGGSTAGTGMGIYASGVSYLTISRPNISQFSRDAIRLNNVNDFSVAYGEIVNNAYAGVMLLGCARGSVRSVHVKGVLQPTGFTNSYGIAATRDSSVNLATSPRAVDINIVDNIVEDVTGWEGIDTHGGQRINITDNTVRNCNVGIACVPCPDTGGVDTYAPLDIVVAGNTIDGVDTDGSNGAGIMFVGAGITPGTPVEAGTGVIASNTVSRHGLESNAAGGGITAYITRGLTITNNLISEPGLTGINLYHTNERVTLAGNTVIDAWTTAMAYTAAVFLRSTYNTVTMVGNVASRGTKTATIVNQRGLYVVSATGNTIVDSGNDWDSCTTPVADTTNVSAFASRAKKAGFYGVTPVVRATVAVAATDAATTQTLANDLRAKLIALGLVV